MINTSTLGSGGSPIASVQRGTSSSNATITAVDMSKSFTNILDAGGASAKAAYINTPTNVIIVGSNVTWEVIEYV